MIRTHLKTLALALCLALWAIPALAAPEWAGPPVKYVFLFIGDGMAIPQRNAAESYLAALRDPTKPTVEKLQMSMLPVQGVTTTYSSESLITDSAAAGTAIASGVKTFNAGVGVDVQKKPVKTVAELVKEKGRKVGIISSVSIDHATPAVFYAHEASRKNYYEIASQLPKSGFDFFAGGGFIDPEGKKSKMEGEKKPVLQAIKDAGYTYINDQDAFRALKPADGPAQKIVFVHPKLQDEQSMRYDIDKDAGDLTLADLTAKGIEMLDNPKGFFLMVESGKIDWACHANDAMGAIGDTLAFDKAVGEALKFQARHPKETLIVVTGDHETGGMSLGFSGTKYETYFERLKSQKGSYVAFDSKLKAFKKDKGDKATFEDVKPMIAEFFGLKFASEAEMAEMAKGGQKDAYAKGEDKFGMTLKAFEAKEIEAAFVRSMQNEKERPAKEMDYRLYGGYEPLTVKLTQVLNQKSGIAWTSYSHTASPVLTSAKGVGENLWAGYYDNTDFFTKLASLMGVKKAAK